MTSGNAPSDRRFPITAGALVRRDVRAVLDLWGLTYREHKGWLESTFVVEGTAADKHRVDAWLRRVNELAGGSPTSR